LTLGSVGCQSQAGDATTVVIYTSVDQVFSEPILRAFEAESGITVQTVFDIEAAKTTGLVNRLIAERERPQADVWWNGEFAQTIDLADQGILMPYRSPSALEIPEAYVDPAGLWTGVGGRARVILVNTELVAEGEMPAGIEDLVDLDRDATKIGIALPVFGTTATQAAALYALWGREKALAYFQALRDRGVRVVDGNGAVRDLVAEGQLAFGLTDTDDACGAVGRGAPVKLVFPDQGAGGIGTLVIPNTVALVAGAPHADAGRKLIDYLLSPGTEAEMVKAGWSQIGLRPVPPEAAATVCVDISGVRGMDVNLLDVAEQTDAAMADLGEMFVR